MPHGWLRFKRQTRLLICQLDAQRSARLGRVIRLAAPGRAHVVGSRCVHFVDVAVPLPLRHPLTYSLTVDERTRPDTLLGRRVVVPLRRNFAVGTIIGTPTAPPKSGKTREIIGLLDETPAFDRITLQWLLTAADYYLHPIGEVLATAAPVVCREALEHLSPPLPPTWISRHAEPALSGRETLWSLADAARLEQRGSAAISSEIPSTEHDAQAIKALALDVAALPVKESVTNPTRAPVRRHAETLRLLELLGRLGPLPTSTLVNEHGIKATALARLRREGLLTAATPRPDEWEVSAAEQAISSPSLYPPHPGTPSVTQAFADESVARDTHRHIPGRGEHEAHRLTGEQRAAVTKILKADAPGGTLLEGVTGSGKTEVYLTLAREALAKKRSVLVLVPEIALTPQLLERFRQGLGEPIAVFHSEVTARERLLHQLALRREHCRVALGARSALFAPLRNLGLIVVDEEHDSSYKQEEGFRYHARDLALLRAARHGALCVLGSATPSLESLELARKGSLSHLHLTRRISGLLPPSIEVIDRRTGSTGPARIEWLSPELERALKDTVGRGEQAILFLNRRGTASAAQCLACGTLRECPACSVALTWHGQEQVLLCHYCGYRESGLGACPKCQHPELSTKGLGTERVSADLQRAFPDWRLLRLDRDATSTRGASERILKAFRNREADVLVGTQMVAKGHDIPTVTLVGIIHADLAFHQPDFRAGERALQTIFQVAGRAGRAESPGRVLLQTYQPEHPVVQTCISGAVERFRSLEREARTVLGYPPFARAATLGVSSPDAEEAEHFAEALAALIRRHPATHQGKCLLRGPAPAAIFRLRARFRFRLLLSAPERTVLRQVLKSALTHMPAVRPPLRLSLDIDPMNSL